MSAIFHTCTSNFNLNQSFKQHGSCPAKCVVRDLQARSPLLSGLICKVLQIKFIKFIPAKPRNPYMREAECPFVQTSLYVCHASTNYYFASKFKYSKGGKRTTWYLKMIISKGHCPLQLLYATYVYKILCKAGCKL